MNPRPFLAAILALCLMAAAAVAQTASDPGEGVRLVRDPASAGAYTFSWWGRAGRTYFLQQSEDLLHWTYVPVIEPGAGQSIGWGFASSADRFFVRLRYADVPTDDPFAADFDGDHVSNYDELLAGTDPFTNADSDHDGLPDDWETRHFGSLGVDPDADFDGDGASNRDEFTAGTGPLDFYNGRAPVLSVVSGDAQTGSPNCYLSDPVVVSVRDANGTPLANAPVTFSATAGGGQLQTAHTAAPASAVSLRADEAGLATVYILLPGVPNQAGQFTCAASNGTGIYAQASITAATGNGSNPPPPPLKPPSQFIAVGNPDGSVDMWWIPGTSPNNAPQQIAVKQGNGHWGSQKNLGSNANTYHIPAP